MLGVMILILGILIQLGPFFIMEKVQNTWPHIQVMVQLSHSPLPPLTDRILIGGLSS